MTLKSRILGLTLALALGVGINAVVYAGDADSPQAIKQAFQDAKNEAANGKHYSAAAIFFNVYTAEAASTDLQDAALGMLTENLIQAGFPNAASYFFIKTLQTGNRPAIRRVVSYLPTMIEAAGGDLLRKYILRYTFESDYDASSRTHFFYFLGKDELLKGDPAKALQALSKVTSGAGVLAQAAYLRGTAYAMLNQTQNSINAFESCRRMADKSESRTKSLKKEYFDLEARCTASLARANYEGGRHDKAEDIYDEIPKASFVWTDILFEQGWNSFAKGDYNRTLGKLVTYRSPSLNFVFNPEVDVLQAQSYLALCHYDDVSKVVSSFKSRYAGVGGQMKNFLLSHDRDLGSFYAIAKQAFHRKLHTNDMMARAINRFVRGPYFASLVSQERMIRNEAARAHSLSAQNRAPQFGSFLDKVLGWRTKTVHLIGGLFVKNSMNDLYQDLLTDLDKMSFIELEVLKQTKSRLERKPVMSEDEDGVMKAGKSDIDRRDYQYFWTFNGEFWADELGDYVFALESQCGR